MSMDEANARAHKLARMKIIYIAGRFRGKLPYDVHLNVIAAEAAAIRVADVGAVPLCPHTMYKNFDGTQTGQFWLDATQKLLDTAEAIFIFDEQWRHSVGTVGELRKAVIMEIPIFFRIEEMCRWLDTGVFKCFNSEEIEVMIRD
jgi:hypothetical protein